MHSLVRDFFVHVNHFSGFQGMGFTFVSFTHYCYNGEYTINLMAPTGLVIIKPLTLFGRLLSLSEIRCLK